MPQEAVQAKNFCAYGCGREAKHSLRMKGGGWKFCCSPHYQQCPAQRAKRGAITRTVHARQQLDGTLVRRSLLREAKRDAGRRNIPWAITDAHFYALIQGVCYYCGLQSAVLRHGWPLGPKNPGTYMKVDRFDESEGYTPHNCVPCCAICAMLKEGFSPEKLWERIQRIAARHPNGIVHPSKATVTK